MAAKTHKMFIGGKWVDAADGKTFEDMNPYTREVYAYLPAAKREDAKRAIEAAQAAFPGWAATPPSVKRKIFLNAADIMERRQDELVRKWEARLAFRCSRCSSCRGSTAWQRARRMM